MTVPKVVFGVPLYNNAAHFEQALESLLTQVFTDFRVVLVDDDDLRSAMTMIADSTGVLVEPAGAAGVAALMRHTASLPGDRVALLLTGAAA